MGHSTIEGQYRALKEHAAIGAVDVRGAIAVRGKDRGSYLHGLLTNDVQALGPGEGCYAAWLTPQGRMITDLHVFESGDEIRLDVPAGLVAATLQRLDQSVFTEDVQLSDVSPAKTAVWIHGPDAPAVLEGVLPGLPALSSWPDYHNARSEFHGSPVMVARINQLGVPGFCVQVDVAHASGFRQVLEATGVVPMQPETTDAARIETGYPVFGIDMSEDTIPLEAGIEDRAISFTKGCYVGQEVIIRVLHRGHGRVARKLVILRVEGDVPPRGTRIMSGDRDVGAVTSAARSPNFGSIAMGYVHRDFTAPGTDVQLEAHAGRVTARVSERPIPPAAQ